MDILEKVFFWKKSINNRIPKKKKKGMYFTSTLSYARQYAEKSNVIIFCVVTPGNIFPVTEHPKNQNKSFFGKALLNGYQSHYTLGLSLIFFFPYKQN